MRLLRHGLIALVLLTTIGAPIVETFDSWDPSVQQGGGDTEANAVVAALCVGIGFAIADLLVRSVRARCASVALAKAITVSVHLPRDTPRIQPFPTGRAPTPLRL